MRLTEQQEALLGFIKTMEPGTQLTEEQLTVAESLPTVVKVFRVAGTAVTVARGRYPMWAIKHFPESTEDFVNWTPIVAYHALHRCVLVVMTTRVEGTWKAYCAPVSGMSHVLEVQPVLDHGCTVGEQVARCLFPGMEGIPYDR